MSAHGNRRALVEWEFLQELFEEGERVVVAVSGGADSMVLLELLAAARGSLQLELHVVHVNYGLRGQASALDEALVRARAKALGIFLTVHRATELSPESANLEARARDIRHKVFASVAREIGASAIALGHTRDDAAETTLMQLLRGSGLSGLSGLPAREGQLVRPLINARRAEVREYAAARGIAYRDDASNADVRFTRNRVRHLLIPLLEQQFNPQTVDALTRSAELLRDDDQFLDELAASIVQRFAQQPGGNGQNRSRGISIDTLKVVDLPRALQRRVLRALVRNVVPPGSSIGHGMALEKALDRLAQLDLMDGTRVEFPLGQGLTLTRSPRTITIS